MSLSRLRKTPDSLLLRIKKRVPIMLGDHNLWPTSNPRLCCKKQKCSNNQKIKKSSIASCGLKKNNVNCKLSLKSIVTNVISFPLLTSAYFAKNVVCIYPKMLYLM